MVMLSSLLPDGLYTQPVPHTAAMAVRQQQRPASFPRFALPAAQAPSLAFLSTAASSQEAFQLPQQAVPAAAAAPSTAAAAASSNRLPAVTNLVPAVAYQAKEKEPLSETLKRAGKRALGGGIPGAAAMGIQVRRVGGQGWARGGWHQAYCLMIVGAIADSLVSHRSVAGTSAGRKLACYPACLYESPPCCVFPPACCDAPRRPLPAPLQVLSLMWLRTTVNYQYRCVSC